MSKSLPWSSCKKKKKEATDDELFELCKCSGIHGVWPFCRCNLAFKTLSSCCQSQIRCLLLQLIADIRSPSRTGSTERQAMLFATGMGSCIFKYKVVEEFWIQFRWAICFYKNMHLVLQVIIPHFMHLQSCKMALGSVAIQDCLTLGLLRTSRMALCQTCS